MDTTVSYIGHATILIETAGVRLLTDPLLVDYVGPLRRQAPPADLGTQPLDAVLISHLHGDHFDLASLKKLGRDTRLIVPKGAGPYLRIRRFHNVEEIERGETVEVAGVQITATRADHGGRQLPWVPATEPLGYIIDGSQEIYFAGDTDLFEEMSAIGVKLDLALLPVWGWGPNLGKGHMDPLRAARALSHLQPVSAIPIHWGCYCPAGLAFLRPRFLSQPPLDFAEHAADIAPEVDVRILEPGQSLRLVKDN
jgi:L-ascorbate metabolism protein UlaG (beta-lactamase superfamily)